MLYSPVAAQASAVPGTAALLTATPPAIATPQPAANTAAAGPSYVGSRACQRCHAATCERWSHTRMANIITDPKVNPRVVLGDFKTPNPLVAFTLEDVAFVYGTKRMRSGMWPSMPSVVMRSCVIWVDSLTSNSETFKELNFSD